MLPLKMAPPLLQLSTYARELLGSSPSSPLSPWSPTILAEKFRRPSRLRGKVMILALAVLSLIFISAASRHTADFHYYDQTALSHLPNPFSGPDAAKVAGVEDSDHQNATSLMAKKPKFHLLVPGDREGSDLCKTMLSAAVLNYPPPTLVNFAGLEKPTHPGAAGIKATLRFLNSKDVEDDDIVLIVNADTWFQLPAEVLVHRFTHENRDANLRLYETYGLEDVHPGSSAPVTGRRPKFTQKVLFAAGKTCTPSYHGDPACEYLPESPVSRNAYGGMDNDDAAPPRYLASGNVIGRAKYVRRLYQRANDIMTEGSIGAKTSQAVFSKIFAQQEIQREIHRQQSQTTSDKWREWFAGKISGTNSRPQLGAMNLTDTDPLEFEFGVGLDYDSSIFQAMDNSVNDVRFIRFDYADRTKSPHRQSGKSFSRPITLPNDLALTRPPFDQNRDTNDEWLPQKTNIDSAPIDLEWSDVNLATNIAVPGSQVPASLNFHETRETAQSWWHRMWYHEFSRALLRRYMRSSQSSDASQASIEGGDRWWDLRGGKGGVWTDRDEWLEWNEICGEYDAVVFDDGHGKFGEENGADPVYNSFGTLMASD